MRFASEIGRGTPTVHWIDVYPGAEIEVNCMAGLSMSPRRCVVSDTPPPSRLVVGITSRYGRWDLYFFFFFGVVSIFSHVHPPIILFGYLIGT